MTTAALRLTMDKNGYRAQQQVELADAEFQVLKQEFALRHLLDTGEPTDEARAQLQRLRDTVARLVENVCATPSRAWLKRRQPPSRSQSVIASTAHPASNDRRPLRLALSSHDRVSWRGNTGFHAQAGAAMARLCEPYA